MLEVHLPALSLLMGEFRDGESALANSSNTASSMGSMVLGPDYGSRLPSRDGSTAKLALRGLQDSSRPVSRAGSHAADGATAAPDIVLDGHSATLRRRMKPRIRRG